MTPEKELLIKIATKLCGIDFEMLTGVEEDILTILCEHNIVKQDKYWYSIIKEN